MLETHVASSHRQTLLPGTATTTAVFLFSIAACLLGPLGGTTVAAQTSGQVPSRIESGSESSARSRLSGDDASLWSLRPLRDAQPPDPQGAPDAWRSNPIDRFIFERLGANGLTPSEPADKRTLIRRLTYNLTGLPPGPDEVADFIADTAPGAYERLVDRLLASPHYGEHWGRHWLDVVRFGESRGFERNEIIRNAWPFRDYVIRSFNKDRPFDEVIREHLAGDVIGSGNPDAEIATTFLVCGPYDDVGNQDPEQAAQIRANTIDEMIRATTEAFLGLTVGCARCHDHKFDPILQKDYYALYATFAGVRHGSRIVASPEQRARFEAARAPHNKRLNELGTERTDLLKAIAKRAETAAPGSGAIKPVARPKIDRTGTEETFPPVRATRIRLIVEGTERDPNASSGYNIDEFEVWSVGKPSRNVAAAAAGARAEGASRVAEDFAGAYGPELAIDGQFGARWIASGPELIVTFAQPENISRVLFSSDRTGTAGDHSVASFVSEYRIEAFVEGGRWVEVANSHDRQPLNDAHRRARAIASTITDAERDKLASIDASIDEVRARREAVPDLESWWVGNFQDAPGPFHVFVGGNPQRQGEPVVPASLTALNRSAPGFQLPGDSAESRRRMELADWIVSGSNPLTPRVLANRVWHYHFGTGIVDTPSDFGENGGEPTHPELLDWLAGFLRSHDWRLKPLHRLIVTSQTYRQRNQHRSEPAAIDGANRLLWRFPPRRLRAEELRDTLLTLSGQLDPTAGGPGFQLYRYLQDNVATYVPLDTHGPETYRRAVYHHNARAASVDLFAEFDCPDNAFPAPRRASTTTPLQALTLLNHSFTVDMASAFARRLVRESAPDDPEAQTRRAFILAFHRDPNQLELTRSVAFITDHGLEPFCRVLLNANELLHLM